MVRAICASMFGINPTPLIRLPRSNREDIMNISTEPLTAWSFDTENETILKLYVDKLFQFAAECEEHPGEQAVLRACGMTRHVWDTAEGLTQRDAPISPRLLEEAIRGINLCIQVVSQMQMPVETPLDVIKHVHEMTTAMTERRDDLSVLLEKGKMAFIRRLQAGLSDTD